MIRAAIIPNGNVVASPAVAHVHVVVLGDVAKKEPQEHVGLIRVELDDAFRESEGGARLVG